MPLIPGLVIKIRLSMPDENYSHCTSLGAYFLFVPQKSAIISKPKNDFRGAVMPTYGYQCTECDHTFEVLQKITDEPIMECTECKGMLRKLLYPVGIVFKGSGFHVTDYKKPEKNNGDDHKESKPDPKPSKETVDSTKK